jgi:hypothetical protein
LELAVESALEQPSSKILIQVGQIQRCCVIARRVYGAIVHKRLNVAQIEVLVELIDIAELHNLKFFSIK